MSADLIAFLKAWHDWATSGAPDGEPFGRRWGLCGNAGLFGLAEPAEAEIKHLLGRTRFPFGYAEYATRFHARTQHECPKRLAWVRARLVEAGELVE